MDAKPPRDGGPPLWGGGMGPGGFRPGMGPPGMGGAAGRRNLTEGPITSTLLLFSLPLLGGNLLQSLNAAVNQFWVGHTRELGVSAISALSNANIVMMLMLGSIYGVSMAANILV